MDPARLGPYQVDRELGSGGMGTVYAATVLDRTPGLETGQAVALKVFHPHLLEQPGFFRRFLREAEIGASVRHPNVVRTHLADALGQDHFLVMEYVEGQTLRELLAELERVPEELCRHIGREVAKGLAAIHAAGVVHRDLKPENVLITCEHEVKVMDLGVARMQDELVRLSQTGTFVGSILYAAPEQFRGGDVDHRADLHALGLLLYELASGRHPYHEDDFRAVMRRLLNDPPRRIHEVSPQLSPFYEEVVHTLLAKEPDARFASATQVLNAFEEGESGVWWQERRRALRVQTRRPLRRVRVPRATALCGRDDDMALLRSLHGHAAQGAGQVVLVEGEAGIGKTRLVDEFVGRLVQDGEDVNFLFGSYAPTGASAAAGAWSTAFREQFGADGSAAHLSEMPILVPGFDALLRGDAAPAGSEPLTKGSLGTCFVHATRALARERTTVILIDDLHFAPEEARGLFTTMALAVPGHRVLLIGTLRPGVPGDWIANVTRLEHATHTTLERLGPKDLTGLLVDAFSSRRLAEELGFQIAQKSDGNPFFVFEIIRGLQEGQLIRREEDGSWVTTRVIEEIEIPTSILDLVNARVAGLAQDERNLLDVAACCGYEFDPLLVGDVVGVPHIPLLRMLGQIERRHRLVRASGRSYVFDHHQVQEALYGTLSELLREEYHAVIATALETSSGALERAPEMLDGALCLELCRHLLEGAQGPRALRYLDASLMHLQSGHLHAQAVALATRALGVEGLLVGAVRVNALLAKADRLDLLGRRSPQEAALREAVALADDLGDPELRVRSHRGLAWCLICQSRYDDAEEQCSRTLALCRDFGDRKGEAMVTGNQGAIAWYRGQFQAAAEHFERHIVVSHEVGDRLSEAKGAGNLGIVLRDLGRRDEARAYTLRHLEISREIGYRGGEANATGNLGLHCWTAGEFDEARGHYERQLVLTRQIGDRRGEATANGNLGLLLKALGRFEESREHIERHRAISQEIGDRRGEAIALVNLGNLLVSLGATEEARSRLEESLELSRETGAPHPQGYALHGLGDVAEMTGDVQEARRRYTEALELRRRIEYGSGIADSLRALALLELGEGRGEAALPLVEEAQAILATLDSPGAVVVLAALRARLPGGDAAEAAALLRDHASALGHEDRLLAAYLLWKAAGDAEHLRDAHRLLEIQREHAPAEYRDTMLRTARTNREIVAAWNQHAS